MQKKKKYLITYLIGNQDLGLHVYKHMETNVNIMKRPNVVDYRKIKGDVNNTSVSLGDYGKECE